MVVANRKLERSRRSVERPNKMSKENSQSDLG